MARTPVSRPKIVLFGRLDITESQWLSRALRDETVGGVLLLASALIALVWANSPWGDTYQQIINYKIGPAALGLDLPLYKWAADGLLAIFFYVAGVELKHELVLGTLSKPAQAAVPVAAALGGMALPALLYAGVNITADAGEPIGWGIPMATDIAFALAVLAVVGRRLPAALRAFLLTLAVVDDLGAIIVIAVFYSDTFRWWAFLGAVACLALFWWLQHKRVRTPWIYVPLVLGTWILVHESGIHATIAGVALGLLTRVKPDPGEKEAPGERMEHLIRPISAGFAVPAFAFFSAGVDLRGTGLVDTLSSPVAVGVILGLVVGKPVGALAAAWLTARFTRASLSPSLAWRDVAAVGMLAGIGFTVSLLIAELAFEDDATTLNSAKLSVLVASVIAAVIASLFLLARNRHYAALADEPSATD